MTTSKEIATKMAKFAEDYFNSDFVDEYDSLEQAVIALDGELKNKKIRRNMYEYFRDIADWQVDGDQDMFNDAVIILTDLIEYERRYA
jgi:hypothetical protein